MLPSLLNTLDSIMEKYSIFLNCCIYGGWIIKLFSYLLCEWIDRYLLQLHSAYEICEYSNGETATTISSFLLSLCTYHLKLSESNHAFTVCLV